MRTRNGGLNRNHYDVGYARRVHEGSTHAVVVVLLREGCELTLPMPPEYLGLTLRSVEAD